MTYQTGHTVYGRTQRRTGEPSNKSGGWCINARRVQHKKYDLLRERVLHTAASREPSDPPAPDGNYFASTPKCITTTKKAYSLSFSGFLGFPTGAADASLEVLVSVLSKQQLLL